MARYGFQTGIGEIALQADVLWRDEHFFALTGVRGRARGRLHDHQCLGDLRIRARTGRCASSSTTCSTRSTWCRLSTFRERRQRRLFGMTEQYYGRPRTVGRQRELRPSERSATTVRACRSNIERLRRHLRGVYRFECPARFNFARDVVDDWARGRPTRWRCCGSTTAATRSGAASRERAGAASAAAALRRPGCGAATRHRRDPRPRNRLVGE